MTASPFRRKVALLLLVAFLAAPWLAAAEPAAQAGQRGLGAPWDLVAHLWSTLTAAWGEEGCRFDPYGGCAAAATPPEPQPEINLDAGCLADPFGGCTS